MSLGITSIINTSVDSSNNLYLQMTFNVHWQWNSSVISLSAHGSTYKDRWLNLQTVLQVTRRLWLWRQNFHVNSIDKYYQSSRLMKHTLINFHKRKRNNECQASETLSYIVYAEGGGGYFNIGKSWKSLGFPTATMSTNDMNHCNTTIATPLLTRPIEMT